MDSTQILLDNLKKHFAVTNLRALSKKINISTNIILNWSSGRSFPNIKTIDDIAYSMGVATYQLLIPNNTFNIDTPIWKDTVYKDLSKNLGRLKNEHDIHESSFYNQSLSHYMMSYRSFLRYLNGQYKILNLKTLDILAQILSVKSFELLESGDSYEKKN